MRYGRFWKYVFLSLMHLMLQTTSLMEMDELTALLIIMFDIITQQFLTLLKNLCEILHRKEGRMRLATSEENPALGGRGPGIQRSFTKTMLHKIRRQQKFDSTLGFPGEGWGTLKMATWNTRSLTYERFKYYENLGYDVLAITELW